MAESKREEDERLQHRTDELKEDHADLSTDVTPFNTADRERHNKDLRKHKNDLAVHKRRREDDSSERGHNTSDADNGSRVTNCSTALVSYDGPRRRPADGRHS